MISYPQTTTAGKQPMTTRQPTPRQALCARYGQMLTPAQNHSVNANSDILTMLHMCTTEDEMASYVTQQYRWLIETLDQRYDALKAAKTGKTKP